MIASGSTYQVSPEQISGDQVSEYAAQAQSPSQNSVENPAQSSAPNSVQNSAQNSTAAGPPVPVVPSTFPQDTVTISSAAQNMVRALNASGESPDLIAAQLNLTIQSVEDSLPLAATAATA